MSIDEVKQTIEEIHDNNERIKQILSTENDMLEFVKYMNFASNNGGSVNLNGKGCYTQKNSIVFK